MHVKNIIIVLNVRNFNEYGSNHNVINRKLCFFCGKVKSKKTKITGNFEIGHTQICSDCESSHDLPYMN